MRLRLVLLLALGLAVTFAAAGSSSTATKPSTDPFLGDWTATAASSGALRGKGIIIEDASKAEAESLVGPEWKGSPEAYFTKYCGAGAGVFEYVRAEYGWKDSGKMGGCLSRKTAPHIILAGTNKDAASLRVKQRDGLGILEGWWEHEPFEHDNLVAELTTYSFSVVEQGHKALPKGDAKFLLTKVIGQGDVTLREDDSVSRVNDATGRIRFRKWRVFAHGVIDEDDMTLTVGPGDGKLKSGGQDRRDLSSVVVTVKKFDHTETDKCRVGSTGRIYIKDHGHEDALRLSIRSCGVDDLFLNGHKGSKVAALIEKR